MYAKTTTTTMVVVLMDNDSGAGARPIECDAGASSWSG